MHLAAHLHRQREWSERTFGPGPRTTALRHHVSKELLEIAADPADPEEWIDVAILAFDGALRTGATPEQVCEILRSKQAKNEVRRWPDPATANPDKAAEHLRPEAPTPHVFKVGDRVRIARKADRSDQWEDAMDATIGSVGTVERSTDLDGDVCVRVGPSEDDYWYYHRSALDLVAAA